MPRDCKPPSNWTDKDTRLIQYSILTKHTLHTISKATLLHSGEKVFVPRRTFANKKRSRLIRSLPAFQKGNSWGVWQELPEDYDPTDYIEHFDAEIILPLLKSTYMSQFSHDFTNDMVSTLLEIRDVCIFYTILTPRFDVYILYLYRFAGKN